MKLPHQFKVKAVAYRCRFIDQSLHTLTLQRAIIPTFKKRLEFDFHSCTFHTLHEVVTGLRTVSGHLIKVYESKAMPTYHSATFTLNASFARCMYTVQLHIIN